MDRKELITLAYELYPIGIREIDEEKYINSPEFRLLKERINTGKATLQDKWSQILNELSLTFTRDHQVAEMPTNVDDRCFKVSINLTNTQLKYVSGTPIGSPFTDQLPYPHSHETVTYEKNIFMYVSLIVPFFAICVNKALHGLIEENSFHSDPHDEQATNVSKIVTKYLPEYQIFPSYYSYYILEGIEIDTSSYSFERGAVSEFPVMTMFNAFFSSRPT